MNWSASAVLVASFAIVSVLGFLAARWRRGDLGLIDEWGLAGRRFGTIVTWFLLGGDLYTAYAFVAVPALVFGAGAIGFFALPYAILAYPIAFVVFSRLWTIAHRNNHVTLADFVRGRYGSGLLALVVAVTGIIATLPYIALQLVGMQVFIAAVGMPTQGILGDLPLIIAFLVLAAFTYTSGLRAPAIIAVVKDTMIYITIIVAVIIIPARLGGFGHIFASVAPAKLLLAAPKDGNLGLFSAFPTLALGSALALFLYPHSVTGILSASSAKAVKRNMALLPAYTLLFGLIALMGYMAIAAGVEKVPAYAPYFRQYGSSFAVPALFLTAFPSWFVGFASAAIVLGALVPAAVMSIASANLFTRNIYKEYMRRDCTVQEEARMAKLASLVVKVGALAFVIFLPLKYAIQLQLLGGIWIIQTLPAVFIGLYTAWARPAALFLGWVAGILTGTGMVASLGFKSSIYPLHAFGFTIPSYAALSSLAVNLIVAVAFTSILDALGVARVRRSPREPLPPHDGGRSDPGSVPPLLSGGSGTARQDLLERRR